MGETKYKRIFILGSGFSKSISSTMPTLKDLSKLLLKEDSRKNYFELVEFVQDLVKLSDKDPEVTAIENLATLILSKNLFYNTEERIYYDILRHQLLRWVFNKIEAHSPIVDPDKRKKLIDFINQCCLSNNCESKKNSMLISFNYDLLLERLLSQTEPGEWNFDYIIRLNRYLNTYGEQRDPKKKYTFEYLKLHGSFNWFTAPGAQRIDLSNVFIVDDADPSKELIHHKDIPVYIPMAFSKMQFLEGSLYNVLWNIAKRYLEEAEEIIFIGYGFPQSDLDNLYFFLKYKHKIRDIVIYGKDEHRKMKRLKRLFPESNIINKDAFEYIEETYLQ